MSIVKVGTTALRKMSKVDAGDDFASTLVVPFFETSISIIYSELTLEEIASTPAS